jgi:hypothetical protein
LFPERLSDLGDRSSKFVDLRLKLGRRQVEGRLSGTGMRSGSTRLRAATTLLASRTTLLSLTPTDDTRAAARR